MRFARRATIVVVLIAACAAAAPVSAVVTGAGSANASASGSCQLGTKAGDVKHVIYLQFDNTHYKRDNPNVASDLEQMPHLLNFLKGNGTLLTNDHTILISHTAGGILSSLTGLYPDRTGQTVSNSYDFFRADGHHELLVVVQVLDRHGRRLRTTRCRTWSATAARRHPRRGSRTRSRLQRRRRLGGEHRAREQQRARVHVAVGRVARQRHRRSRSASSPASRPAQILTIDTGAATETATIATVGTAGATGTGVTLTAPSDERARIGRPRVRRRPDRRHDAGLRPGLTRVERGPRLAARDRRERRANLAQTDFVGYAIHCAQGAAPVPGQR